MKKKIVILSEALGGGVRRHLIDLIMNINMDKFDIYFLYGSHRMDSILSKNLRVIEDRGVKLIEINRFNNKIGKDDIYASREIYKEIKKISPDILHCHSSKAGALGRVIGRLLRVPKIYYTPHAYVFQNPYVSNSKKNIYIYLEKIMSRYFTTKTINVSNGEKNEALKLQIDKAEKFVVIYNGIEKIQRNSTKDILEIKKELGLNADDFIVGNIARVDEQKDPISFIEIAKNIIDSHQNIKFVFVGDGDLIENCKEIVCEYSISDKVLFTGFKENIDKILYAFDILLTTSRYEGLPYSLIEASRGGIPIVATNVIGNSEIVLNGENGFLFALKEIELAMKSILTLYNNRELREKFSQCAVEQYEKNYTLEKMVEAYENLYCSND